MKDKAIGIIYFHSPSGQVRGRDGEIIEIKTYKNGGKYVSEGRKQYAFGKLPKLTDAQVMEFEEVFC